MGTILAIFGLVIFLVGWVMLLVEAFSAGVMWGLGCLLAYAVVAPIFVFLNWGHAKKAFLIQLVGIAAAVAGWFLGPGVS